MTLLPGGVKVHLALDFTEGLPKKENAKIKSSKKATTARPSGAGTVRRSRSLYSCR